MALPPLGNQRTLASLAGLQSLPVAGEMKRPIPYPLGRWRDGKFDFHSPEAEQQWEQDSYSQGTSHLTWMKGRRLRPEEKALADLGVPRSDDTFMGPDGHHYQSNLETQEPAHLRALRGSYLAKEPPDGSAFEMGQRAIQKSMPAAQAWIRAQAATPGPAKREISVPANDNRTTFDLGATATNDNNPNRPPAAASQAQYPRFGRFAPIQKVDGVADLGRSKAVATRSLVERLAPTNFEALARDVEKYEADNPALVRLGQRLDAGILNIKSGIAAWAGSADATSLQRMAPYLERIEKGEPISEVLPTLSNGQLDPSLDLTRLEVDFIRRYYGTPEDRKELHQELTASIGKLLAEAATTRAESEAIARHPAVQALAKALHEGRYLDAAKITKTYPIGMVAQVGVEGLPSMLPGLAASAIDPALGAVIFAGSDSATAYGNALLDSLAAQGIDVADGDAIQTALDDPDIRNTAMKYAKSHAAGAAALALVTGGIGGKVTGEATSAVTKVFRKEIGSAVGDEGEALVGSFKATKGNIETIGKNSDEVVHPSEATASSRENKTDIASRGASVNTETLPDTPSTPTYTADELAKLPEWRNLRNYQKNYFKEYPQHWKKVNIHHARPRFILRYYPGLMTEEQMHAVGNLRGIPKHLDIQLHQRDLHMEWNWFKQHHKSPTLDDIDRFVEKLDAKYGHLFLPPIEKKQ